MPKRLMPTPVQLNNEMLLLGLEKTTHVLTIAEMHRGALLLDLVRCVLMTRDGHATGLPLHHQGRLFVQNEPGRELALDLEDTAVAAVLHDAQSVRSPARHAGHSFFAALTATAPRARMRTIERIAVGLRPLGAAAPWITTVLWSEGKHLCTPGSWSDFLANGGWMIEPLFMDPRSALRGYQRTHALSDAHMQLITSLLQRRLETTNEWLLLEREDYDALLSSGQHGFITANDLLLKLKIHNPYRPS